MKKWLLLFLLVSCAPVVEPEVPKRPHVEFDNGAIFTIDVAETYEEKVKGLMNVTEMPENHGMLFLFEEESMLTFWMKDTLIPLDIIFFDENMNVVHIASAVPCTSDPCPLYQTVEPAQFVLEINQGMAEKKGVALGMHMSRK